MHKLSNLIHEFGKDIINTITKYPSILTLHKLGDKGRLTDEYTTPGILEQGALYATEKIDGTNVRVIIYDGQVIIGSRENLLHLKGEKFYDPSQSIVDGLNELVDFGKLPWGKQMTVIYGELFGGNVSSNSKDYGKEKMGFRVFDVAIFGELEGWLAGKTKSELSRWREQETDKGIVYGQNFLSHEELDAFCATHGLTRVPMVNLYLSNFDHEGVLDILRKSIPTTNVALTDTAKMGAEGIVLRDASRKYIVKIRYEDYERTIRAKAKTNV